MAHPWAFFMPHLPTIFPYLLRIYSLTIIIIHRDRRDIGLEANIDIGQVSNSGENQACRGLQRPAEACRGTQNAVQLWNKLLYLPLGQQLCPAEASPMMKM
jgi:hypothetical protein